MAKFKVAAVFSNHMVLQRDKNIQIFGTGENGAEVAVHFLENSYTTYVKDEKWSILLPPQKAKTGLELIVSCKGDKIEFSNIAIGEVWLAGGQSNMELELKDCTNGKKMLQEDVNPKVRFYYTPKNAYIDDKFYSSEEQSGWNEFSEENAKNWSAVGYIFGKRLAKELDVTIGIIGCNWGGTSASCWMSEKSLEEDRELNWYIEDFKEAIAGKSEEEQIKEYQEYEEYVTIWNKKCDEQYALTPDINWEDLQELIGESRWPGPRNCRNPLRPAGLYHTMLSRVAPYTLRGFIYYQGEGDDHKPMLYQKLLTRLIRQWREDWEDNTLPFLFVQLPMHRYKADPDFKNWCFLREAQMNTFQTVKNTGVAVILDCGEFNEIHPKDKAPVGERLALQALSQVYHTVSEKDAFGPIYCSFEYKAGGIELHFDHAQDGFVIGSQMNGFEIAGDDLNYVEAKVEIKDSVIFVSSPEVIKPRFVRYQWTNYGEVNIFGQNGIPLAPFRTSTKA
jgi:sialate O-acetylesterase